MVSNVFPNWEQALKKTLIFQQNMYNYASKDNSVQLF